MHNFKELKIWKRAMDLSVKVYEITSRFPDDEKFGLTSQIRRAAVSISSNIAEGAGRNTDKEFVHFLGISNGSCFELETQLRIAMRLDFITSKIAEPVLEDVDELQKMTHAFKSKLKST